MAESGVSESTERSAPGIVESGRPEADEQRSVVFGITLATGFLAVVAGTSALLTGNGGVGVGLLVVGFSVFGLSALIATGLADEALFDQSADL